MGQGFSSNNNLHLQLDRPWYHAGEVVTGKLYLNVVNASVAINALYVKAHGKEYTMYYQRERVNNTVHYYKREHKNHIFKINLPLLNNGELAPGNYEFPLSFQLPDVLPGSFDFRSTYNAREARACIRYKIKAELDVKGLFSKDPKAHAHFHILQQPSGAAAKAVHDSEEVVVTNCCCSSKGSILLSADAGTNVLHAGDTLGVTAQVENKSALNITSVKLQLEQCAVIKGDFVLCNTLGERAFEGVPKGTSRTGASRLQAVLPLPQALPPTSAGQLTRVWYQVKVRAETEGCCNDSAELKTPVGVEVAHAAVPALVAPQRPPGWHPMVFQQFAFSCQQGGMARPLGYSQYVVG